MTRIYPFPFRNNAGRSPVRTYQLVPHDSGEPFIAGGIRDMLARAIHDNYRALRTAQNTGMAGDPAMKPWSELDEEFKESNRKQADHIVTKLQAVNCGIEPRISRDEPLFTFNPEEVEKLAELEHQRWNEERSAEGWKYGPVKDNTRKITPWLVPYPQLPEEIKEYDRDPVRNIPAILARAGLKVARLPEKMELGETITILPENERKKQKKE